MAEAIAAEFKARIDAHGAVESTRELASAMGVSHDEIVGVANSLTAKECARTRDGSSAYGGGRGGLTSAPPWLGG